MTLAWFVATAICYGLAHHSGRIYQREGRTTPLEMLLLIGSALAMSVALFAWEG